MSMGLRYEGGFRSRADVLYEVKIFQKGYVGTVTDVAFCDDPLLIEWPEVDKLEPVMSSNATLRLYSDNDRQFIDLYTIEAGSVRMDVHRNGSLYWSGTLDPELYEEPFAYKGDYAVEITFADFAILDRLNWSRGGFATLRQCITETLSKSAINYATIIEHISTKLYEVSDENILDAVSVNTANFFDEDGEPMTTREVLDEVLRPFALRLQQKDGHIYIYDLNAIYKLSPKLVRWEFDDAMLGVDKVYNNVIVTFSKYEKTSLLDGSVDPDKVGSGTIAQTQVYATAPIDEVGFRITLSDKGEGVDITSPARYFRIDPEYSGSKEAGVAWTVKTFKGSTVSYNNYLNAPTEEVGKELMRLPDRPYLIYLGQGGKNYKLKVKMSMLFDTRYNPFEDAHRQNEEGDYDRLKNWCNFAYVPITLTLRDEKGTAISHWMNNGVKNSSSFAHTANNCRWVPGEASWGDAWLCWYQGDRKSESGLGGWQSNKQIIGYYRGEKLPLLFDKMDAAEYIDLPEQSGYLDLRIGVGVQCYDYKDKGEWQLRSDIYTLVRWILYKDLSVKIVSRTGKNIEAEDIEHKAWLNPSAKEKLEIDTLLGCTRAASPTALGQLLRSRGMSVISTFFREGVEDAIERLLIATVYSNYASRHTTLAGTVSLLNNWGTYADANEYGRYTLLSEEQNLREDESSITMVQFEADNYKGVEWNETI